MGAFLRLFKHLLPNARAWRIVVEKQLREFFEGLAASSAVYKIYFDEVWLDIFPETTREIAAWELQFGLFQSSLTEQERRDRLAATWKALGGQSPRYIQDTLQAAGFDVYVHEWWDLTISGPECGELGAECGEPGVECGGTAGGPVAKNPNLYLDDGTVAVPFLMYDGAADAQDGDEIAMDGATAAPRGYPLVNKISEISSVIIGDGAASMNDGATIAQDGGGIITYNLVQYVIPGDPTKWPYFLYIGGATFPDQAIVPETRRDEFENLCLKICPTEQWLGILVTYT